MGADACHIMKRGEILNANHSEYPLFFATLYGDKISTAKLSKRLSCSIKHLPIRLHFDFEYDTIKAIEAGVSHDPTIILNGEIFLEGLVQAEEIIEKFNKVLTK